MTTKITVGHKPNGSPLLLDIAKAPHVLVAGATGSGKSVCLHNIICELVSQNSHKDLRLVLLDPKRVELSWWANITHLLTPIVTDQHRSAQVLQTLCAEMEWRYSKMAKKKTRDFATIRKAPRIVTIIDEYANLALDSTYGKVITQNVIKLAQLGRAAGIHLILATQYPLVKVVNSLIKANIPARICFALQSQTQSRVVLDQKGAEKLCGAGDGLLLNGHTLTRFQGVMINQAEIERLTKQIKRGILSKITQR